MILRLKDLIPYEAVGTQIATGQWVRAMHEPFRPGILGRFRDALAVLRGQDVFAVRWPQNGEFEQAMVRSENDQ